MRGGIGRRSLLLGALGLTGAVVFTNRDAMPAKALLGPCDVGIAPAGATAEPGPVTTGSFPSARRGRDVGYAIAYPPGARPGDRLPVCVVLHGLGADEHAAFDGIGYHRYLAGATAAGVPPFALAACAGGNAYWHRRSSGDDPLGMVLDEFLPLLSTLGLDVKRPALLGWSMGGFGVLQCALARPGRFAAVVANAPAVWRSWDEVHRINPIAFDSAADWAAHDLVGRAAEFRGVPLRIDCGEADKFAAGVRALRDHLPDPSIVHFAPGCHDNAFWHFAAPVQLRYIGRALND